ncbi:glucosaminidase domain-containing protein [Dysgonomonas sp. HGC4]|uniref:glucosaminidase domain-containing protein n=1 Tax=Dysgonomonas sp. HGC4 TaxID=1658009 RepID=UPI000680F5AB|nr:glucosaminidase domain-containing protein [Dysgonomonas sp. HGC4]MBD8347145.1 glucosaminidase domain-containing protein [Dysgonomonas sp. HGC4]
MTYIFERKGILRLLVLGMVLMLFPYTIMGAERKRNTFYDDYIDKYKDLAISHMKKYKIPASITLAQGLLESGAGRSSLTVRSNNHFGIKCHNGWKGESVIAADDTPNDCFRKYKKAEDSFDDHSRFLSEKQRYSDLFSLGITDYRGWARGLQKAGYATDKAYANKLIKLIEDYELYRFDKKGGKRDAEREEIQIITPVSSSGVRHTPYKTHGLVYVVAQRDDTYASIANEFGFKVKDLCEYNEVPENFPIQEGDLIYFQKKKKKADKPYYEHVVQVGESMYSISQLYGVKVSNLYKMNKRDFEYVPVEGDILRLR